MALRKLNSRHIMIAHLEAMGRTPIEIAEITGYHPNYVHIVRTQDIYKNALKAIQSRLSEKLLDQTVDLSSRFNQGAAKAVDVLEELRDDTTIKPATRLKATIDWLNRSTNVPQATQTRSDDAGNIHIHLSAKAVGNIRDALSDNAEEDLLDVMDAEFTEITTKQLPPPKTITATQVEDISDEEDALW